MDKPTRDKVRQNLIKYPGQLVPIPGTNTVIELLDQIDQLEYDNMLLASKIRIMVDRIEKDTALMTWATQMINELANEKRLPPRQ